MLSCFAHVHCKPVVLSMANSSSHDQPLRMYCIPCNSTRAPAALPNERNLPPAPCPLPPAPCPLPPAHCCAQVFTDLELCALEGEADHTDGAARAGRLPPDCYHQSGVAGALKRTKMFFGARCVGAKVGVAVKVEVEVWLFSWDR